MHEVNALAMATAATPDEAASIQIAIGADTVNDGRTRLAYLEFVADAKRAAALKRQADEASSEAAAITRNSRNLLKRRTGDEPEPEPARGERRTMHADPNLTMVGTPRRRSRKPRAAAPAEPQATEEP